MKRQLAVALSGIAAASIVASALSAQEVRIRFGSTNDPGGTQYMSGDEFVNRLNEQLGDQVNAEMYGSSQLGTDTEMLQKVKLGTLEIAQPSTIMSTVLPEFGLFDMPYLVKDRDHMVCISKEIIWPEFAPRLEEQGYKLVGVWENGFRQITNNVRPINTPEDLRDIKLRVPGGVWRIKMFESYGANPTPMEFAEVFVGLQTGVIDGQENPYANIWSAKFQEVQQYLSETNHVFTPSFPTASLRLFEQWPEEVQNAVMEIGAELQQWTYDEAEEIDGDLRQKLIDAGIEFNEADRAAFIEASKPIYEQFAAEVDGGQELIDRTLALADEGC
jgi:TRAP-type transport system periplasmic protein